MQYYAYNFLSDEAMNLLNGIYKKLLNSGSIVFQELLNFYIYIQTSYMNAETIVVWTYSNLKPVLQIKLWS